MSEPRETPRTILTVDDDPAVRATLVAWIEDAGHRPLEASSGLEGLELLASQSPDLVLLDLRMPVMDGLTFLEEKNARNDDTPVIVISGRSDMQDAIRAFRFGAWDYLTKPIESFDLLGHAVSAVLERRELARKVRQAEDRYANLVRNLPLVVFSLDERLELQFVNMACRSMLGFTPEEALAEPGWLPARIHPDERPVVTRLLQQALADCSVTFSRTCRMLHRSGRVVHGILKSIPQADCEPGVARPGIEGVILDITDRLMLEKYLVQKEKVKTLGAISAEVAHEIRNPLMSIGGYARRLQQKQPGLTEAAIILDEARRLEKLLDRIRDYLTPVKSHRMRINLADVVIRGLELLAPSLEANDVHPRVELDRDSALVEEDPDILAQIVIDLIRATQAALAPKGEMWLRCFAGERFLNLEVGGDQARPVEDVEKLFLPFDEGGESVGLASCYRMLRSMGGSLTFEQKDGKGLFTMSVPRAAQLNAPAQG
ncbi:Regulator of RpoS [Fundidesulfovibrio magnetotacticus]|uniref:histidine kinase n=1 Tax=Fundidesulfovibrio magnetotacticus TaxID=2730080 RepID=A0A6V8M614_9BACT|nr:response regulator [Fundidesulfovibrio magnetotacticus]GFK96055.1 Regulator of RpoS [Fundidesulfovibrio magnetotacticus]